MPITTSEISAHLLADWIPSLPLSFGPTFLGWPPYLLETLVVGSEELIIFLPVAGRSERQWKGFLSWMLGVAGTRHFLAGDNYRWVAPVSAFDPAAIQPVDLSLWSLQFPPTRLKASARPGGGSRLRPDYLALRRTVGTQGSAYDWAVVEAKGTRLSLSNLQTCPTDWSSQVRNIVVSLDGSSLPIQRYLVVAIRANPNGTKPLTRRIQVRAWNRRSDTEKFRLPAEAAVEVAAAHMFGLFKGVGLRETARAIAFSVQARAENGEGRFHFPPNDDFARLAERAESELERYTKESRLEIPIETDLGTVLVELAEPIVKFARGLRKPKF
jgi:hypothetical protein